MQQATHRRPFARVAVSEVFLFTSSITAEAKCLRNQFFLCKPLRYEWQCLVRSASECHGLTVSAIRPINALLKGTSDLLTCSRFMVLLNRRPNFCSPNRSLCMSFHILCLALAKDVQATLPTGKRTNQRADGGRRVGRSARKGGRGGGGVKPSWNQRGITLKGSRKARLFVTPGGQTFLRTHRGKSLWRRFGLNRRQ